MTAQEFERLYEQKHRVLQGYVRKNGDPKAAEELVQEAFLILWEKRGEIAMNDNIMQWMFKTLRYLMANHMKKIRRRNTIVSMDEVEQVGRIEWSYGLIECEMLLEEYMSVRECQLFLHHYGFGVPLRVLAQKAGLREETLRVRLSRLKIKIKCDVINHNNRDIYR